MASIEERRRALAAADENLESAQLELHEAATKYREAVAILTEIAEDDLHPERVEAASELLRLQIELMLIGEAAIKARQARGSLALADEAFEEEQRRA
ncbi:MAG: hypothetical protein ACRDXX_20895 [Stackebrandtia sp.]